MFSLKLLALSINIFCTRVCVYDGFPPFKQLCSVPTAETMIRDWASALKWFYLLGSWNTKGLLPPSPASWGATLSGVESGPLVPEDSFPARLPLTPS